MKQQDQLDAGALQAALGVTEQWLSANQETIEGGQPHYPYIVGIE